MRWKPSKRQLKEIDRFRGAVLVLPWPENLPEPAALRRPHGRVPTRLAVDEERDIALSAITTGADAHDLRIGDVTVVWPDKWPNDWHGSRSAALGVFVIGSRWPQELHRIDDPASRFLFVNEAGPEAGSGVRFPRNQTFQAASMRPQQAEVESRIVQPLPMSSSPPADMLANIGRACFGERWRMALAAAPEVGVDDDTIRRWTTGRTPLTYDHGVFGDLLRLISRRRGEITTAESELRRALNLKIARISPEKSRRPP